MTIATTATDPTKQAPDKSVRESAPILRLENVSVVFDGFKALDVQELAIEPNELRVIIGPNGAGKTTLCDVVSGKTKVTTGQVFFEGAAISGLSESQIARKGVGRKFQTPSVFDSLTVYENMELALPYRRTVVPNLWVGESADDRQRIMSLLSRVRLMEQRRTEAKYLSHGQRQWLEICMLILAEPKLLLVDEPAAGLTDTETALTAELLLELMANHTLIVIEHDMDFVRQLNQRVTVLNEGRVLADGTLEHVQTHPQVIEAYLGR